MKTYVKCTITIVVVTLVLFAMLMMVVDPLFQYHYPLFGMKPNISTDEQYYVAGIAKNFDYENVIIGTSMSQNFRASWFDEAFGGKTVKLTIGGAMPKDYNTIFKLVKDHGNVKRIFMDLSNYFLISDPNIVAWNEMPSYLYNESLLDDTSYLLNKDLLIVQGGYQIVSNLNGTVSDIDEAFCWDSEAVFNYSVIEDSMVKSANSIEPASSDYLQIMKGTFNSNVEWICKIADENPEINFVFFLPPYSSAFWYLEKMSNTIDFWEESYVMLAESLLSYDNVSLYYFYDDKDVEIENWALYRDTSHYNTTVNKYIFGCFKNMKDVLTKSNYLTRIHDSFERFEKSFSQICVN